MFQIANLWEKLQIKNEVFWKMWCERWRRELKIFEYANWSLQPLMKYELS